jgi:multidrug efflux pump subunit AcrA (membrane-fusion protein)
MSKKKYISIGTIIVIAIIAYFYFSGNDEERINITSKVRKGTFKSEVIISGEAQSTSAIKINGPENLRKFKLRDIKIQDLIAEGTIVKKGDYVGRLDPTGVNEQIIDTRLNLESAQSKYTQQKLDTTLTLKNERNGIKDLIFELEETKLELKQSIYETPATIRKLEINFEKVKRDLKEKKENYEIKRNQAKAKMVEVGTDLSKIQKKLTSLTDLLKSFTIYSNSNGMITYAKNWDGSKKKVGSSISPWNPTIANLPDLTKMESKTYANEVDIRRIKTDLPVKVGFDAFPEIEIDGIITSVANVGEKKKGSDIKIFQILIKILKTNKDIRPGMTTSNNILTYSEENVLSVPLEAIFSKDSIKFAYVKSGFSVKKKQIELGVANNIEVIIKKGLNENDEVYLTEPKGFKNEKIKLLNDD